MLRLFILIFLPLLSGNLLAQNLYTVSGTVIDIETGEPMTAASLFVIEIPGKGTLTNELGQYSIELSEGNYTLVFNFFGYRNDTIRINLKQNITVNSRMQAEASKIKEIVISGKVDKQNVQSTEMGKIQLSIEQAEKLPALLGETDLMKTIQLLPGVQAAGEGNSGIYVRGGGPDQNLVLMDDAPVYNTGHLFGFFSVFNSDAISNVTLHKGNMPAAYGGRISSVVDFTMKEGDFQKYHGEGGIGLIASRLTLEGPIIKDKASFMVSGRRTYLDIISKPFVENGGVRGVPYFFYDLNGKLSWKLSPRDKLLLSGYYGKDDLRLTLFNGRFKTHTFWGNETATLKWNHIYNEKLFHNVSLIYNKFGFISGATFDQYNTQVSSSIKDFSFKTDFDYVPVVRHNLKAGILYTYHTYTPRRTEANADTVNFTDNMQNFNKYAHDFSIYLSDEFTLTDKWKIHAGLRYNVFAQVGPYKHLVENNQGSVDTTSYSKGEIVKTWGGLEPRIAARYLINENSSIKTAFNINNQYINMVSLSGNSMPFDIWLPASILIKPQKGWQYSLGYFRNLKDNNYEFSAEVYYKRMINQLEYRQDYIPKISGEIEEDLVSGKGRAYGLELFVKKKYGNLQGWIGYTLSRSMRQFEKINDGKMFPARYDRIHDFNAVATYDVGERWTFGATFVYATGQAITLPERRYFVEGIMYFQYSDRNEYRMQPYNRLDIAITYKSKETKKFRSSWTVAVYNVYNRKNPYIYTIDADGNPLEGDLTIKAKKLYLFPILPSLTWNFSF